MYFNKLCTNSVYRVRRTVLLIMSLETYHSHNNGHGFTSMTPKNHFVAKKYITNIHGVKLSQLNVVDSVGKCTGIKSSRMFQPCIWTRWGLVCSPHTTRILDGVLTRQFTLLDHSQVVSLKHLFSNENRWCK